jgi:hypothetical protein
MRRVRVDVSDVMIPFAVLIFLNCLVLALWTGLDPLTWERIVVDVDVHGRVIESTGGCESDRTAAFLGPLIAINGCALIMALRQAYIGRGMSTDFSESKYIASKFRVRKETKPGRIMMVMFTCLTPFPPIVISKKWPPCVFSKLFSWVFPSYTSSMVNQPHLSLSPRELF